MNETHRLLVCGDGFIGWKHCTMKKNTATLVVASKEAEEQV
jgi:hypothetical protein